MRIQGISSVHGLRDIQRNLLDISKLQEKLSSGQRLNRASDGPADLVLSERLRAQLAGFSQASENLSRTQNLLDTADGALSQISELLTRGQSLALEAQGAFSDEELQGVQVELDSILGGIQKIAGGTDFAGQKLVDGSKGFTLENVNDAFSKVDLFQVPSGSLPLGVTVEVSAAATKGQATGTIAAGGQVGDASIQIQGSLGTAVLSLAGGASQQDVIDAVNAVKDQTGVEASAGGLIQSSAYGSSESVSVSSLSGSLTGITDGKTSGTDVSASVNGIQAQAQGNTLTLTGSGLSGQISLDGGTGPGAYGFQVTGGGLGVQAGDQPSDGVLLGLPGALPQSLGLQSLFTGGANSLLANPAGAAAAFESAVGDVAAARGRLGAFQSQFVGSLSNHFQVAYENLAASESRIRDTDFATTLSELASKRIRSRAGISVLAQSQRLSGEGVLRLLG